MSFPALGARQGISVSGTTLAVTRLVARAVQQPYMGPCPIRHCPRKRRGLSGVQAANLRKIGDFGKFRCKITRLPPPLKTLLHCKNSAWDSPPPQRGRHAGPRQGQIYRRFQSSRASLCLDRALQPRPWRDPWHRHRRRQGHAGRSRGLDRNRSGRRRLRPLHLRAAAEKPRRHAASSDQPHAR